MEFSLEKGLHLHKVRLVKTLFALSLILASSGVLLSCSYKSHSTSNKRISKSFPYEEVVRVARSYLGTPYRYGGMDKNGMDCSGLVCRVYAEAVGLRLPRTADAQALRGQPVQKERLQPGDLVFFREPRSRTITHVGIVHKVEGGDIKFIHAASGRRRVVEDSLMDPHWKERFVGGRRVISPSRADARGGPLGKSKP